MLLRIIFRRSIFYVVFENYILAYLNKPAGVKLPDYFLAVGSLTFCQAAMSLWQSF